MLQVTACIVIHSFSEFTKHGSRHILHIYVSQFIMGWMHDWMDEWVDGWCNDSTNHVVSCHGSDVSFPVGDEKVSLSHGVLVLVFCL
jgi:hypothetical protein